MTQDFPVWVLKPDKIEIPGIPHTKIIIVTISKYNLDNL